MSKAKRNTERWLRRRKARAAKAVFTAMRASLEPEPVYRLQVAPVLLKGWYTAVDELGKFDRIDDYKHQREWHDAHARAALKRNR